MYFFLGHKSSRQGCIDHVDVDPRNMIGNNQCAGNGMRQIGLDLNAKRIQQRRRPSGFQGEPLSLTAQWKHAQ